MPIYELRNKDTGEVFEKSMKIAEYEEYLKENPSIERYHSSMHFQDSISLGIKKPDGAWFDVLDKIKRNNPGHQIGESRWSKPREW